jgi:periplasmic protein CpxP/Spy
MGLQLFTRIDALFTNIRPGFVFTFLVERKRSKNQEEFVKSKSTKFAVFGVLAMALLAAAAFAQDAAPDAAPQGGPQGHYGMRGPHGQFRGGEGMGFPMRGLNLTEDQHAQIKQIMQAEKGNIHPLMQQEFQAHLQMMQLITSGNFDQAKATALASQEAQTHIQMQVEHAKIASQIYQLLSSDQKAKVTDMMAKHQQMMQERFQKAPPADNQ